MLLAAQPTAAGTPGLELGYEGGLDPNPYMPRRERRQAGPGESTGLTLTQGSSDSQLDPKPHEGRTRPRPAHQQVCGVSSVLPAHTEYTFQVYCVDK